MTSLSRRTTFPPGWAGEPLERRIALSRVLLAVERILPRLWPAFGFGGFYLALALTGLFQIIAWPVQALLLAATLTAIGLSLENGFRDFSWPHGIDGARRLERDNNLLHRPISERGDRMAGVAGDGFAEALWKLHQARALPGKLRLALPHTDLAARDPQGLRWYLLIALAVGLAMARSDTGARLIGAFDSGAGAAASIDAWVDPPPYTGMPLVSLHTGQGGTITVPQGSVVSLRVHGAPRRPGLVAGHNQAPRFAGQDGEYSSTFVLAHNARVRVQVGGHAIGRWDLRAAPDAKPTIAFTAKPKATAQLATDFAFRGRDDHGVTRVHAILKPHGKPGKPLVVDLPLPQVSARDVAMDSYVDLTGHPYAGLMVDARLEARDATGQTGISEPVTFKLPARVFTDPLARALVEQRQRLATSDAAGKRIIGVTLDALSIGPERFYDNRNDIFLAIRNAYFGVRNARKEADYAKVQELLWQTALKLERGGLLSAAEELRKLQRMLTAALAAGAPQDVIDELLKRYNEAMQRYLEAMKANPGAAQQQPLAPDTRTLGEDDIQTLMKMIQQLSEAGDRKQAAQLLAMLQSMLENLHMQQGGGGQDARSKALNEQMQKFGDMMGQQRSLLDKTFRQGQGQGDPKDGGAQGLARQQNDLQKQLQDAMKGMDPKAAGKLGEAGRAMDQARKSLERGDLANAGNAQNQALDALRQGAQQLAQAAQEAQNGRQPGGRDPLGRGNSPLGNSGVKIPGPDELARAKQILEELRRRSAQMNRPQQERDYLDRLLKAF
jgi:uncharacterized protein (TIGR02302 family)